MILRDDLDTNKKYIVELKLQPTRDITGKRTNDELFQTAIIYREGFWYYDKGIRVLVFDEKFENAYTKDKNPEYFI